MDLVAALPQWSRRLARNYLKRRGLIAVSPGKARRVWIDVGAHLGEGTLDEALRDPNLLVFAFEPNWALARQIMGRAANFVVLPMAVSDSDGRADFFVNARDGASSLARMEESGLTHWKHSEFAVKSTVVVQTVRLDTFMKLADLRTIDYLKVDAEGVDLRVIQSAGERVRDIKKITLEVDIGPDRLYQGAPSHDDVLDFMQKQGFELTGSDQQNFGLQENLTFTARKPEKVGV
jgi:FkbM family methyltransferase